MEEDVAFIAIRETLALFHEYLSLECTTVRLIKTVYKPIKTTNNIVQGVNDEIPR